MEDGETWDLSAFMSEEPSKAFRSNEFKRKGMVGPLKLYETNPGVVQDVGEATNGTKIEIGATGEVLDGNVGYTVGASPCVAAVVIAENDEVNILHSIAGVLGKDQQELLRKAKAGIIGGGSSVLKKYKTLLEASNVTIIKAPDTDSAMSVAVVRKKVAEGDIPQGIFFDFTSIDDIPD